MNSLCRIFFYAQLLLFVACIYMYGVDTLCYMRTPFIHCDTQECHLLHVHHLRLNYFMLSSKLYDMFHFKSKLNECFSHLLAE